MCLTYKPLPLPDQEFAAYKVYLLSKGVLLSPHNAQQRNGMIQEPGTYTRADRQLQSCMGFSPRNTLPSYVVARRSGGYVNLPISPEYENWDLDIPGFHVIATKEEATLYQQHLEKGRIEYVQDETNIEADRNHYREAQYVVVPVKVEPIHVYATGHTPFGDIEGDNRPAHEITTYVAHQITIPPEAFAEVVWEKFLGFDDKHFLINDDFSFEDDTTETPNTSV